MIPPPAGPGRVTKHWANDAHRDGTAPPEIAGQIAARMPSRRLSTPGDVAALIVFLASAANHNVSGEVVRGGSATGRPAHSG